MNLQNIITEIEKADPEVYDRLDNRRGTMRRFAFAGKVLAAAAVPAALGSLFKKAYGQNNAAIVDILNFALTLEYMETEFYTTGLNTAGLIPAGPVREAVSTIRTNESNHVTSVQTTIRTLGGTPIPKPTFDFTGGKGSGNGPFAGVFANLGIFLALAQTFEDTGVRAYKGQAAGLMSNNDVLQAALQIHSVEARHAAALRSLRRNLGLLVAGTVQPWITLNQSNINTPNAQANAAAQKTYNGEENTTQGVVNTANLAGLGADIASESFDEPLTRAQVLDIANPFLV